MNGDDSGTDQLAVEGQLFHSSDVRQCSIDGEKLNFVESGDFVVLKNKRVYVKGRTNRLVKINGKMVNLVLLESVN